ncbi:MAG: CRISPR-associated helicase Cas3' [Methanotrichaceae archaeon]
MNTRGSAILMSPTGSGKTEAALLWAVAQADDNHPVPRLYYMLPYQASMNAMYDRLNDGSFPGQVGLEHGKSTLAYYRRLLEDLSPEKAASSAKWLNNLARLNYYPVRVLSPYQILKGPYCLKGYESLLSDCFNAVFILDEVHAYEAKRLALILATIKYLRLNFGSKFFVMSATFPSLLRSRLLDALGDHSILQASPELYAKFRRHKLMLRDGSLQDPSALDEVAEVVRHGQSVLVCRNTVRAAQETYFELQQRLGSSVEIILLHGRFNGRDRIEKENRVRQATGSNSSKRTPILLIATQVVEVSLDIDLDVIYTDPAPLEALLQRFGRVNRRRLKDFALAYVFKEPSDGQRVYDKELVHESLKVLQKNDGKLIDEAKISDWLDEIYQGKIADNWNSAYQNAYDEFWDGVLRNLRAFNSDEGLEDEFYKAFDSVEVLPLGFLDDYYKALENNPLEASQLLIPIRWRQFSQLKEKGLTQVENNGKVRIVNAYYDSEFGLNLKRRYEFRYHNTSIK